MSLSKIKDTWDIIRKFIDDNIYGRMETDKQHMYWLLVPWEVCIFKSIISKLPLYRIVAGAPALKLLSSQCHSISLLRREHWTR